MTVAIVTPTHNTKWLAETWESVRAQTHTDWVWYVTVNHPTGRKLALSQMARDVADIVGNDPRVKISSDPNPHAGVGARKQWAFAEACVPGTSALIELDHDDLLVPEALEKVQAAFSDPEIGFVYSDSADFTDVPSMVGKHTYFGDMQGWQQTGWTFYGAEIAGPLPGTHLTPQAFPPSAVALSKIFWAPNHVRAWRRSVYEKVQGHDPTFAICDDHDLIVRTYLKTKFFRIPELLYLYRVTGENTWLKSAEHDIPKKTQEIHDAYLEKLILRECELLGLPAYDFGGSINPRPGWQVADVAEMTDSDPPRRVDKIVDLSKYPWPFEDNSIGAIRASDLLEHLPDKHKTLSEIHRCLRPGGWFLGLTPSTEGPIQKDSNGAPFCSAGRGAHMDPTHVSYWNEPAFWYYTRKDQAKFIRNETVRFQEIVLKTFYPSDWHFRECIPYVHSMLIALKDGYVGPGLKQI